MRNYYIGKVRYFHIRACVNLTRTLIEHAMHARIECNCFDTQLKPVLQ